MERRLLRGRSIRRLKWERKTERSKELKRRAERLNCGRLEEWRKQREYAGDGTRCTAYKRYVRIDHWRDTVLEHLYRRLRGVQKDERKKLELSVLAENQTSATRKTAMVRCTRKLDKQKCNSASTAAICMEAAEKSAHCCEGLGAAKCRSKTQKQGKRQVLQKYCEFVKVAFAVLFFTEARTLMAASCSFAVELCPKRLD